MFNRRQFFQIKDWKNHFKIQKIIFVVTCINLKCFRQVYISNMIALVLKLFETATCEPTSPEMASSREICLCIPLTNSLPDCLTLLMDQICPLLIPPEDVLHLKSLLEIDRLKQQSTDSQWWAL
jgi:hypothetical protein